MKQVEINLKKVFDNIYDDIETISESFKINHTYLNTLKMVIDEYRLKKISGSLVKFGKEYNKLLDSLYDSCKKHSEQANGKNKVHLFVLKDFINIIKENILK